MPSKRGVSGFWLDLKALENHRTHLVGEYGAKEGLLVYGFWVRIFTWQYQSASPIRDARHAADLTGLNVRTAQRLMRSLAQSLPQSFIQRSGQWYCKRTMQVLTNYNQKQELAGTTCDPKIVEDSDSDSYSGSGDLLSSSGDPSLGESKKGGSMRGETQPKKSGKKMADRDPPNCPHQKIIYLYHKHTPCRRIRTWEGERPGLLRTLWRKHPDLEWWAGFFQYVSESDFLCGRSKPKNGDPPFMADLEWLIRPNNFQKIYEGKYHRVRKTQPRPDIRADLH